MNRFCHASQEACLLFDESIVKRFGRIAYLNEQLNYDPNALHIYWNFIDNEFEDSSINHKKLDNKELDELRAEAFSFYIKGMDEYKKYIDFSTVGLYKENIKND